MKYLLSLTLLVVLSQAKKLNVPSYFTKCEYEDPKLSECMTKTANNGIQQFLKGDPVYSMPTWLPLQIESMKMDIAQLKLDLINGALYGLEKCSIISVEYDKATLKSKIVFNCPNLYYLGKYKIAGKLLSLNIFGEDNCRIDYKEGVYTLYNQILLTKQEDGTHSIRVCNSKLSHSIENISFDFKNLLGNEKLSKEMNEIMNKNSKEIEKDLGPYIAEGHALIIEAYLNIFFKNIPYENVFIWNKSK